MEANVCDVSHLDTDVLLPPRKRLLAGLKKHNSDGSSNMLSASSAASEFDTRFGKLLRSHLNDPNLSSDEIIETSRLAAEAAIKVAEAARAAAEEKAAKAAKAVAAAKSALELVVSVSEEAGRKQRSSKKNKMKKHVPVQMLYNKHEFNTDEELARKLHQVMNSSPRISKHSSPSDMKGHKYKKLKSSSSSAKAVVHNKGLGQEGKLPPISNGNGVAAELDSEASILEEYAVSIDENKSTFNQTEQLKMDNSEAETTHTKDKIGETLDDTSSIGKKRGRLKQKKLPLSICNFRDQVNPKEELKSRSPLLTEESICKTPVGNKPLFPVGSSSNGIIPVEKMSMWKCQAFKAPSACVKQNKVMQS